MKGQGQGFAVTARPILMLCACAIIVAGLYEPSLALVSLGAAVVALVLWRGSDAKCEPAWWRQRIATWAPGHVDRWTVVYGGAALGCGLVAVAFGTATSWRAALPALSWIAAGGFLVAFGLRLDRLGVADLRAGVRPIFLLRHRSEAYTVLAITAVALVLRTWNLDGLPAFVHGDEGELGKIALAILNGDPVPFFLSAPFWGPIYPFSYVQAFLLWAFGPSVASLRVASVLSGVLLVPVVYAIARIGWGPLAAALGAWLLAVSHLHIHYSRLAQIFMAATLLAALVMLLLATLASRAERRADAIRAGTATRSSRLGVGAWSLVVGAGTIAGLAQHIYHSSRVVPIVAGALLLYLFARGWIGRWHIVAFAFAFIVMYAPLAAFYIESPGDFTVRLAEVSAFQDSYVKQVVGPEASLPRSLPRLLAEQLRRTATMLMRGGDLSGFYSGNVPMFDALTAVLIWLGLGAALARVTRYHEAALLVWFALGLFFGSVATLGAQNAHRVVIMLPVVYLLGGVALARFWELLHGTRLGRAEWLAVPAGTTLALWALAANVVIYFFEYAPRAESASSTYMAREMRERRDRYRYYFLTAPHFDPNHGSVRYVAYGIPADLLKTADDFTQPPDDGRGILIFALDNRIQDLKAIEGRLPGGEERQVTAPNGRVLYVAYDVPPKP